MTHIPEEAKNGIIKRRLAGWNWTDIATWVKEKYHFEAHRTTFQKWYDREVSLREGLSETEYKELPTDFSPDAHAKLIKGIEKYKGEARYWKKVAEASLKQEAKKELLVEAVKKFTPSYKSVKKYKIRRPKSKVRAASAQSVVAPLTDTHIGDNVEADEIVGLNAYNIDIFNKRLQRKQIQLQKR